MIRKFLLIIALICLFVFSGCGLFNEKEFDLNKVIKSRPNDTDLLFDYAGILEDAEEFSNKYLKMMKEDYFIEALIVSIPSMEGQWVIEELAVEIFENWKIGKKSDGRGILLLFADKEKKIMLEVGKELEDVFTETFCGYVADLQLRPYFTADQIGLGLIATMEEMEKRSQIKHQGNYTPDDILRLDDEYLTSGAGVKRELTKYELFEVKESNSKYPAGATPSEAWETLIQTCKDRVRDHNIGVYTQVTKRITRDFKNRSDSSFDKEAQLYSGRDYEIIQNNDYAVIYFGNKKGWDNYPYLFARTSEGWKFDIVHQRKYIRRMRNPYWGAERGNYPYIDLLSKCPQYIGQDIPLEGDDVYKISEDEIVASKIERLEQKIKVYPNDFNTVMELGYLYIKISLGREATPLLKKAKSLNLKSSLPYKCLAIVHGDAYQYKSALNELKEYVSREPVDVFGRNYLGYLHYNVEEYKKAIKHLKIAVKLRPDNSYAYCKLSRSYTQLYLKAYVLDIRRYWYKKMAMEMFQKARKVATPDKRRIRWVYGLLKNKVIK